MKKLIFILGVIAGFLCFVASSAYALSTFNYSQGGTGTTTAPVGQLIYGGATSYQSVPTTTASCTGSASCSAFTIIGSSPATISVTGGGSDPFTHPTAFGTTTSATTTPLWAQFGLFASSTQAGTVYFGQGTTTSNGDFRIGTTSPSAFSILDNLGTNVLNVQTSSTTGDIFTVASTTGMNLFTITQAGLASTTNLTISGLGNGGTQCLQINGTGSVTGTGGACGSGGGGSGTVSTSTNEIAGNLAYWTSNSGTPALLGQVATGTVSGAGGVTVTAGRSAVGGALAITCTGATSAATGCISSTDWTNFNNKVGSTSLSGATVISYTSATGVITTTPGTFATGAYTFPTSLILSATTSPLLVAFDPNGMLRATSTPTAVAYLATSTTATSTFKGAFEVGTTTQPTTGASYVQIISNEIGGLFGLLIHTITNVTNAFTIKNSSNTTVFNVDTTATLPALQVGTTTVSTPQSQISNIGLFGNVPYNNSFFLIASSSQTATTTLFNVNNVGHVIASSTSPTLSSCGTGPTMLGDDTHGEVTTGTLATTCTLTFGAAWSNAPVCAVTSQSATSTFAYTISATAISITDASLASDKWDYICEGVKGAQ